MGPVITSFNTSHAGGDGKKSAATVYSSYVYAKLALHFKQAEIPGFPQQWQNFLIVLLQYDAYNSPLIQLALIE